MPHAPVRTPFNQTTLVGTRWGLMITLSCDPYQSGSLALYGEWARAECDLLCSFLKPGDVAVDVGANIGTITVALAKRVGVSGSVYAFEPQRAPFSCLCGNVALTHTLNQTRCFNVAVSDDSQPVQVPVLNLSQPFNVGGVRIGDQDYDLATADIPREEMPSIRLDECGLASVQVIKIDVEAMEAKVLIGAQETIDRCRPVIFAEALLDNGKGYEDANVQAMVSFLASRGYAIRFAQTPLFSEDNIRYCPDPIFPGGDRNLIAIPRENDKPNWWLSLPKS